MSYKVSLSTKDCLSMSHAIACNHAANVGGIRLVAELKRIDHRYNILKQREHYSDSKSYTFKGTKVVDYSATVYFVFTLNNQQLGKCMSELILSKLIENNNGSSEYKI